MSTAKEEVQKMLKQIPDDSSFEDIQYHIYVREKIEHGLKDMEEGLMPDQEEIERRISKWLGKVNILLVLFMVHVICWHSGNEKGDNHLETSANCLFKKESME